MRLIDLHVDWLLQYVNETVLHDRRFYSDVERCQPQLDGYLQATRAAVLSCSRSADDWTTQDDPWHVLGSMIARLEAEFPGRLLLGPDDFERWQDDPHGLAWGLVGVGGFDALIRSPGDLRRLPELFARGVRWFQPIQGPNSLLGGSTADGDDRGLTNLGRKFLDRLVEANPEAPGPRLAIDLADMNPLTMSDALDWLEADPLRPLRLVPVDSRVAAIQSGSESPRGITIDNLGRLRALGGYLGLGVGLPSFESPEAIRETVDLVASLPFLGQVGPEGIAIGTRFMSIDRTLPGLANAAEVVTWTLANFDRPTAKKLIHDNAMTLIGQLTGSVDGR